MKITKPLNLIRKNLFILIMCSATISLAQNQELQIVPLSPDTTLEYHCPEVPKNISNKLIQSSVYYAMGKSYNDRGNFSRALLCFNKSLLILEKQQDSSKLIPIYNQIAFSLNHAQRYEEGYMYSTKAEQLLKRYKNADEKIILLVNKGCYFQSKHQYKEAKKLYLEALKHNKIINDSLIEIHILHHLGNLELKVDELISAGRCFRKALSIAQRTNNNLSYQISNLTIDIGNYYSRVNNLDSALYYYNKTLARAESNHHTDLTSNSYKALSNLYLNNNDTSQAFKYLLKYSDIKNKLFHSSISQQISELYVQFNSKTKDQKIKLQNSEIKSERLTKILLITFLLFISIITVIIFINYYRLKLLNNTLKKQNQKIIKQNKNIKENAIRLELANTELIKSRARLSKQKVKLQIANKKYIKANTSKDKFFDIIAHDLKSPFQSILGFSTLLRETYDEIEDEKKRKYIKLIDSSTQHVSSLIDNLLNWSRSQNERINLVKTKFDLHQLINEKINLFELTSLKKKINIVSTISKGTTVYGDMNMISLALRNIVSNAIKFSYAGSKVEILSTTDKHKTTIYIRDYGIGMPPEIINGLFNIENSKRSIGTCGENGTGLGLIISKDYIEKNNGCIKVISTVGEGSTFCITLPSIENFSSLN